MPSLCAHGEFDADLFGAFLDHNQHDGSHSHASDQQGEGADQSKKNIESHEENREGFLKIGPVPDEQSVFIIRRKTSPISQVLPHQTDEGLGGCRIFRLEDEASYVFIAEKSRVGRPGNEHTVFIKLAAEVARLDFLLHHSNHNKGDSLDEDSLAHSVSIVEKIFSDGVPEQTNTAFEGHVGIVEVASFISDDVADVSVFYRYPTHSIEDVLPAVADLAACRKLEGHPFYSGDLLACKDDLFWSQADAAALGESLVGQSCTRREGDNEALSDASERLQILPAYG